MSDHLLYVVIVYLCLSFFFFFFNDTATTEIYTLSLHDALPISRRPRPGRRRRGTGSGMRGRCTGCGRRSGRRSASSPTRSEEHTSELQSRQYLVCRLLLEKKKKKKRTEQNNGKYTEVYKYIGMS